MQETEHTEMHGENSKMIEIKMTFSEFKRKCVTNDDVLTNKLIVMSSGNITKYYEWVGIGLVEDENPDLTRNKIIVTE